MITVNIEWTSDSLNLSVQDNGRGFDPTADSSRHGAGLRNLRKRADLLAGGFELNAKPGKGTRIHLRVPLKGNRHE